MTDALRELGEVDEGDLRPVINWLLAIPLSSWPKQSSGHPAMINDIEWPGLVQSMTPHGLGDITNDLVGVLTKRLASRLVARGTNYQRMLSVVMPGESIPEHADRQEPGWLTRVHVPLLTNPHAVFAIDGEANHLEVGRAYLVDTTVMHSVSNGGITSRVHFMFDVRR